MRRTSAIVVDLDQPSFSDDPRAIARSSGSAGPSPLATKSCRSSLGSFRRKGAFWFATYKGGMSADLFVEMLKQIMRRRRKPLFLVIDSLPAHKAKLVRDYVETTNGKLKLYFLPGYAPELNPDELVWSHMKRTGTAKRPLASNELLQDRIYADLINIQNNRALIRSFFKAPDVAYIADG
jgi:transposase